MNSMKRIFYWGLQIALLVSLFSFGTFGLLDHTTAFAQSASGTIAYVRSNDTTGDEIHLIQPDGANDRLLWKTGMPGAEYVEEVSQLSWKPDATELAFTSRHEEPCSFYSSDIYSIYPDGTGFQRVTAPPACGQGKGATGTVIVGITNATGSSGPFTVYFEGAPASQTLVIAPGEQPSVIFTGVLDYGAQLQRAVVTYGEQRYLDIHSGSDVLPGQTVVDSGVLMVYPAAHWEWKWPTWRSDGLKIAYALGSGILYGLSPDNTRLGYVGETLLQAPAESMPGSPSHLAWGPAGSHASQLLYSAYEFGGVGNSIFLVSEGSTTPGENILVVDGGVGSNTLGLAWLPDGSGFLYSKTENFNDTANIYAYIFATGETFPLTGFTAGFTRNIAISPDGQQIVFEYQPSGQWTDLDPYTVLAIMNLDGSDAKVLVEDARSPAWSLKDPSVPSPAPTPTPEPTPVPPPPGATHMLFLPLLVAKP